MCIHSVKEIRFICQHMHGTWYACIWCISDSPHKSPVAKSRGVSKHLACCAGSDPDDSSGRLTKILATVRMVETSPRKKCGSGKRKVPYIYADLCALVFSSSSTYFKTLVGLKETFAAEEGHRGDAKGRLLKETCRKRTVESSEFWALQIPCSGYRQETWTGLKIGGPYLECISKNSWNKTLVSFCVKASHNLRFVWCPHGAGNMDFSQICFSQEGSCTRKTDRPATCPLNNANVASCIARESWFLNAPKNH